MKFLCWSYTKVELPACKKGDTLGHFRDILIHWPKKPLGCCWSQQSLSISGFWMLYDGPASRVEKILALKPLCGKRWSSVFIRWRSKSLFRALVSPRSTVSTSDEKCDKINDWNYQIDMLLPKMSRHCVGTRHVFLANEQQKECWQQKKLRCMILHDHKIIWAKICCCNSCTKLQRSMQHPRFARLHFDSQKDDCFNFVESMWYGRSWPRRA